MLKLIGLELKKMKIGWYVRGVLIANICIAGLLTIIPFAEQNNPENFVVSASEMNIIIGITVRATFVVFAAVLLAKLVIEEYRDRTITVLFTYPINRKKIMAAKLIIVGGLTFITSVVSNIFILVIFYVFNQIFSIFPDTLTSALWIEELTRVVSFGLASACMSLIPLYFGMRKKSVPATIVSSLIIVALTSQYNEAFTVVSIIYIPIILAILGVVVAIASIRNINKVDIA